MTIGPEGLNITLVEDADILKRSSLKEDANTGLPERLPSTSIDRFMSLGNDFMDGQARILVCFDGHADEGRLAEAVRLTLIASPELAYRYVDGGHRPYWQQVDEKDRRPLFHMAISPLSDPRFYQFITEPLLPENAPQVRAGLFRWENDVLCIRSNHMALDGGGAVRYLALLASIYKELGKDPHYIPNATTAGRQGPRHVLKEVGLLNAIKALPRIDLPGRAWGVPRTGEDNTQGTFTVTQLGPEWLNFMREYTRERKVTINDVLLTGFCRSLFEICDPPVGKRLRVEVPVNLRRYLPRVQADTVSDLSAIYFLNVERRENETFDQTLDRVHRQLDGKKNNRVELAELVLLELFTAPGPWFFKQLKAAFGFKVAHPVISNLGVIDSEVVDFGGPGVKDVHFIGPLLYPPNIGVGVYTFRGRLNLSLNYPSSAVDHRIMEHFLDRFLKELPGPVVRSAAAERSVAEGQAQPGERTASSVKVICIAPPPAPTPDFSPSPSAHP